MLDAVLALIKLREGVNQGTAKPRAPVETQKAA
jgi:2-dehydropantoate 2-reductase